jgi:hypothetical protein
MKDTPHKLRYENWRVEKTTILQETWKSIIGLDPLDVRVVMCFSFRYFRSYFSNTMVSKFIRVEVSNQQSHLPKGIHPGDRASYS